MEAGDPGRRVHPPFAKSKVDAQSTDCKVKISLGCLCAGFYSTQKIKGGIYSVKSYTKICIRNRATMHGNGNFYIQFHPTLQSVHFAVVFYISLWSFISHWYMRGC